MQEITLSSAQKKAIKSHASAFRQYINSERFAEDQADRVRRVAFFQQELRDRLPALSEADLQEIIAQLWASAMWGNKQYLAQKIISDNGVDKLQQAFKQLLDTARPIGARYWRFLMEVKGLGPASVTEMLCYIQPGQCGIWNYKARQALKTLGLHTHINPDKYRLSADEYESFNSLLHAVAHELQAANVDDVDLLLVDYFLFEVAEGPGEAPPDHTTSQTFDHDEMRDLILNVGVMLGFDAEAEVQVGHGARVDTVWRARIGNLGLVTYVFEVHKSGSIDSLLLNLQRAKRSATVQKVIAVSDDDQLERIRRESSGLPDEFVRSLALWPVQEVQEVAGHLQSAMQVINRLGLVQGVF